MPALMMTNFTEDFKMNVIVDREIAERNQRTERSNTLARFERERLQVSTPDRKPHPSVQAWSRGPIFPAVIARVETYEHQLVGTFQVVPVCIYTEYELIYPGQKPQRYLTREDAEQQARGLNLATELRAAQDRRDDALLAALYAAPTQAQVWVASHEAHYTKVQA